MGKRILVRRRGKGGIQFRAPSKGKISAVRYPSASSQTQVGEVTKIIHERGRGTPLAQVKFGNNSYTYVPAVTGLTIGSMIEVGPEASPKSGNVLPLDKTPEGSTISNIERDYGDGGRLVRTAGCSAILFSHTSKGAIIKMPSGKASIIDGRCRATLGVISGGGRFEKPFLRAGDKFHLAKAKGKAYPTVRGIAMASVHHPFGGGRHQHPGKSTSTSRDAPAGRKVGHIAPKKTGRKRVSKKFVVVRA